MFKNNVFLSNFNVFNICTARSGELSGQLKTVRSQAESAKQELVDYKDKATRILQVRIFTLLFLFPLLPPLTGDCFFKKKITNQTQTIPCGIANIWLLYMINMYMINIRFDAENLEIFWFFYCVFLDIFI